MIAITASVGGILIALGGELPPAMHPALLAAWGMLAVFSLQTLSTRRHSTVTACGFALVYIGHLAAALATALTPSGLAWLLDPIAVYGSLGAIAATGVIIGVATWVQGWSGDIDAGPPPIPCLPDVLLAIGCGLMSWPAYHGLTMLMARPQGPVIVIG